MVRISKFLISLVVGASDQKIQYFVVSPTIGGIGPRPSCSPCGVQYQALVATLKGVRIGRIISVPLVEKVPSVSSCIFATGLIIKLNSLFLSASPN